jgi:hypothetical protein
MVTLLAYEATASDARIGISRVVIDVGTPHTLAGTIPVSELVTVVNAAQKTYVGSTAPANGKPMNLLRFGLAPGATNLATGQGFDGGQTIQVNGGFATTAPVPPGQTEFQFSFEYPYDGTRSDLTYQAFYPTIGVAVLAPADVSLTSRELGAQQTVPLPGSGPEHVLQGGPFPAGTGAAIHLAGLPVPGEHSDFDPRLLYALAGALALVALGLAAYAARRGWPPMVANAARLTGATGARGRSGEHGHDHARADGRPAEDAEAAAASRMLKALAELDRAHDGGTVDDEAYRVQREALKARLKALMLAESETSPARGARP